MRAINAWMELIRRQTAEVNEEKPFHPGESLYANCMDLSAILTAIDEQIATLRQVRELLSSASTTELRTEKAVAAIKAKLPESAKQTPKRTMSVEGRASIAAAQKKRWAIKHGASTAKATSNPKKTT